MKKLFSASLFLFAFVCAKCSHIVGGELFYDYAGNNTYHITLKLYRECYCTNCAPYGDPEYVSIFDVSGNLYIQVPMPKPDTINLPATSTNACQQPPAVCITEADYVADVVLPPAIGGYTIVYQRCCRNNGVVNLLPGQGATYTAVVPGSSLATGNNSARFVSLPPLFVCLNQSLSLSYAATDPDGDSLVYSLFNPYSGADANCPDPSPNGGVNGCPSVPNPPPYSSAAYAIGYDSANFTNSPSTINDLKIDSATGLLTGSANAAGLYDITVCVKEYRNGQLLNILRRDFEVTVSACNIPIAVLAPQQNQCKSLTVNFVNQSYNPNLNDSISYFWNFGVPGSTTDTSTLGSPTFTYPDSGSYNVQLIATNITNGRICSDTTTSLFLVYPVFTNSFSVPLTTCIDSPIVFTAQTTSTSGYVDSLLWNFGDNTTSELQNPIHAFTTPGTYSVTLFEQNTAGCTAVATSAIGAYACTTGIPDLLSEFSDIRLFPNPANQKATLAYNFPSNKEINLFIYNQLGQLVLQQNLSSASNSNTINVNPLADGVYTYSVTLNGLPVKHDKFLIVR